MTEIYKLSPSDFGFLYDECKKCFYHKVKHGLNRPRGIMPSIFTKIDGIMKDHFEGKSPKDITDALPNGRVEFGDRWIQSKPFTDKKTGNKCFITLTWSDAIVIFTASSSFVPGLWFSKSADTLPKILCG